MRYDAFMALNLPPDPNAVVKSAPIEKVGWTDEARAAAAEARKQNYVGKGNNPRNMLRDPHENAAVSEKAKHNLKISSDGSWRHETIPHTHAVMEDGSYHSSYPDKESAKAAAAAISRYGAKQAEVVPIPRDTKWDAKVTTGKGAAALAAHLAGLHGKVGKTKA